MNGYPKEVLLLDEVHESLARARTVLSCSTRLLWKEPKAVSTLELCRVMEMACEEIEKAQAKMNESYAIIRKAV